MEAFSGVHRTPRYTMYDDHGGAAGHPSCVGAHVAGLHVAERVGDVLRAFARIVGGGVNRAGINPTPQDVS